MPTSRPGSDSSGYLQVIDAEDLQSRLIGEDDERRAIIIPNPTEIIGSDVDSEPPSGLLSMSRFQITSYLVNRRRTLYLCFLILLVCCAFYAITSSQWPEKSPVYLKDTSSSSHSSDTASQIIDDYDESQLTPFEEAVTVETSCGRLVGAVEDGAFVFKGLPYALPPVGQLRWSRPIPLWTDTRRCRSHQMGHRRARKYCPKCVQRNPMTNRLEGQEDCLCLNIWTPRLDDSANLEVMVFVHGGQLHFGSGHEDNLRPTGGLSRHSNAVFVSFNYRLHAFGFLSLDLLANSGANSSFGNYALWDAMIVLEWIQTNIHAFGGDPRKVTVFGPDAGAAIILALMTNPDSRALFRSAWLLDPSVFFNRTFAEASAYNHNNFLVRSGCKDVDCLKRLSPDEVTKAFFGEDDPSYVVKDQNDLPIQGMFNKQLIVIDDEMVTAAMPFPPDSVIDIPILVGSAAQTVEFWPGPRDLSRWTWQDYSKYVTTSLDSFGPRLTQEALMNYPPKASSNETPYLQYITMVSDLRQRCPVDYLFANLSGQLASPVFRYLVKSRPSTTVSVFDWFSSHSFHLIDLIAFFGSIRAYLEEPGPVDLRLQEQIQRIVLNFIRDGRPDSGQNPVGNVRWFQSFPHQMAIIDDNRTEIIDQYAADDRCEFWQNAGLTAYAWIS